MTESWMNTRTTLFKLTKLLNCGHCFQPMNDPYFLESCRHTFCRGCIRNETCPQCHIPALAKQITPNRLVSNVLLLTTQLQHILDKGITVPLGKNDAQTPCINATSPISSKERSNTIKRKTKMLMCVQEQNRVLDVHNCEEAGTLPTYANTSTPEKTAHESLSGHSSCNMPNGVLETFSSINQTEFLADLSCASSASTPIQKTLMKVDSSSPSTPSSSATEKKNSKGETPLQVACIKGDATKVKTLLEEGANPNVKDNAGWTPLHEASHHNYLEVVTFLVKFGAFINIPGYDNETPLHDAVQMNNVEVVSFLVRHGADVHARNARGLTPIELAKTKDMENALRTTVSLSFSKVPPSSNNVHQQVVVLCTSLNRKQKHQLQLCVKLLKFILVDEFSDKVTHIVTDCDEEGQCIRTLKYLQGVLAGKWILNFTWIELCIEYKKKMEEEAFEVAGTKNYPNSFGARKGRENGTRQLPQLFDGCQFYFYGTFTSPWPQRSELCTLIRSGGGKLLKREPRYEMMDDETHRVPYHLRHDIVNTLLIHSQEKAPMLNNIGDNVCCVHVTWLLDSISTFTLLPFHHKQ